MKMTATLATLLGFLFLPSGVHGQASTFEQVVATGGIKPGDDLDIRTQDGRRVRARLVAMSADEVKVTANATLMNLATAEVARIRRRDSLANGAWIGAGVGAGTLLVAMSSLCSSPDPECQSIVGTVIGVPAVGLGTALGILADFGIRKTVFEAPGVARRSSVSVVPMVSRRERGVALALRW